MKPAPFEYHAPESAIEAAKLLADFGDDSKLVAGGQSLVAMMALRLAVFGHLVDIRRIPEMKGIERRGDALWVGAGTTQAAIETSDLVVRAAPLLARATPLIGHFQIRNRGTLGGSIAHADPAAEYPAVALALDAEMEVVSPDRRRIIPAKDFFEGIWSTTMASDEILVGVSFPIWSGRCGFAVEEIARRHGDFAIAGAAIAVELDGGDCVQRCAVGLFGVGVVPERPTAVETELTGRHVDDVDPRELGRLAMSALESVPNDLHASAEYRMDVGAVMVQRAWSTATSEARRG